MRRILHEPLLHFLSLGALLFILFDWRGGGPSNDRIVIAADAEAGRLLAVLAGADASAPIETLGDRIMLPAHVERSTQSQVAREFGDDFARDVVALPVGRWSGPVRSGYGLHLVRVDERGESRLPPLAEVRPLVEREFTNDRRTRELNAMYERLLERYRVVIEKRPADPSSGAETPSGPGGAR